jgi:hypothetical protein
VSEIRSTGSLSSHPASLEKHIGQPPELLTDAPNIEDSATLHTSHHRLPVQVPRAAHSQQSGSLKEPETGALPLSGLSTQPSGSEEPCTHPAAGAQEDRAPEIYRTLSGGVPKNLAIIEEPPSFSSLMQSHDAFHEPRDGRDDCSVSPVSRKGLSDNEGEGLINFGQLDSLEFSFRDKTGKGHTSWAIYAEPDDPADCTGSYHQVEAPGEGFGCVDDVSRVALVYLNDYQKSGSPASLNKARQALEFIMYMADGEGEYYNFVDRKGAINEGGNTSKADMDWWTARAFYALGKGIEVLGSVDPEFTRKMNTQFSQTVDRLTEKLEAPGLSEEILAMYKDMGIKPGALVNDSGSVTSIFVLGLLEGYREKKDARIEKLIRNYCSSLLRLEEKSPDEYPFTGCHFNSIWDTDLFELYGNRQTRALADAGTLLGEKTWIESAEREADKTYPRLLSSWGLPFALSPDPELSPQINYSAETVITNLMAVHKATGKEKYAVLAGLFGSWFFGNNSAGSPVYLPSHGRAFDGIDNNRLSRNSGAESNVEALLALEAIKGTPAEHYLHFTACREGRQPVLIPAEALAPSGAVEKVKRTFSGGAVKDIYCMSPRGALEGNAPLPRMGRQGLYMSYRSTDPKEMKMTVEVQGHEIPVHLKPSSADYHYRSAFLGSLDEGSGESAHIVLRNGPDAEKVLVSSLVVQPEIQTRSWTDGTRTLSMAANTTPHEMALPPDIEQHLGSLQDALYSGEGVTEGKLPASGWALFEKTPQKCHVH